MRETDHKGRKLKSWSNQSYSLRVWHSGETCGSRHWLGNGNGSNVRIWAYMGWPRCPVIFPAGSIECLCTTCACPALGHRVPGRVVETFQGGLESIQARGESLCTSSFSCSTEFDLGRTNMFYGGYNGRNLCSSSYIMYFPHNFVNTTSLFHFLVICLCC